MKRAKEKVLTHSQPSAARSVADALVIKDRNLFLVTTPSGRVPFRGRHGFGLYYQDCRWLDAYELQVNGARPNTLMATDAGSTDCVVQMTNVKSKLLEKDTLSILSERRVDGRRFTFEDRIMVRNHGREAQEFRLSIRVGSRFDDVFTVRSLCNGRKKRVRPKSEGRELRLGRRGVDGAERKTTVHFSLAPVWNSRGEAEFTLKLGPGEERELRVKISLEEKLDRKPAKSPLERHLARPQKRERTSWLERLAKVETSDRDVSRILDRSFRDLKALRSTLDNEEYVSAGTPWFATLFGRDSLITALELLPYDRACAADTLRLLAALQATDYDDYRDAEPGKILHEIRVGELARAGRIPHTPYYGTVDATPLFLILLGRYSAWEGTTALFEELRPAAEAALGWIDRFESGFIQYDSKVTEKGLVNQGWKDAGNSILDESGGIPCPPIALVEVQAYACEAKRLMADLFGRIGEQTRSLSLHREAEELRARINREYWSAKKGIFGMARDGAGKLIEVVSSNAGHVLWAGAAEPGHAAATVKQLMNKSMFAGWGVRTLSEKEAGFNPMGYHLGTIWPHDNALIAEGFRRYGFDEEALQLFNGLTEAATHHRDGRLPELFSGFSRADLPKPVRYPVACSPQAWAAGSYPYFLSTLLGLKADAFQQILEVNPVLPPYLERVHLKGISLGAAELDLEFRRTDEGVQVRVTRQSGPVKLRRVGSDSGRERKYPWPKVG